MHKSFIITEEDKRRIIGMHLSATKRQYLSEQTNETNKFPSDLESCLKSSKGYLNYNGNYVLRFNGKSCEFKPDGTYTQINNPDVIHNYICNGNKIIQIGCIQGDCENGQGVLTDGTGNKYTGEFKNGLRNGQGTWVWLDGRKYVGQWENGKMNGKGTYINKDGGTWTGEWKDGNPVDTTIEELNKIQKSTQDNTNTTTASTKTTTTSPSTNTTTNKTESDKKIRYTKIINKLKNFSANLKDNLEPVKEYCSKSNNWLSWLNKEGKELQAWLNKEGKHLQVWFNKEGGVINDEFTKEWEKVKNYYNGCKNKFDIKDNLSQIKKCKKDVSDFYKLYEKKSKGDNPNQFNQLRANVYACAYQHDNFNDLNVTNKKIEELGKLDPYSIYFIKPKKR